MTEKLEFRDKRERMPPYVWMPPICLDTLTHICMPSCSPVHLYVSRRYLAYDMGIKGGIYTLHIECSDVITRIIYKKYYKFVHVRKYKYLNDTPYDLYEFFICLSEGGLGGV